MGVVPCGGLYRPRRGWVDFSVGRIPALGKQGFCLCFYESEIVKRKDQRQSFPIVLVQVATLNPSTDERRDVQAGVRY